MTVRIGKVDNDTSNGGVVVIGKCTHTNKEGGSFSGSLVNSKHSMSVGPFTLLEDSTAEDQVYVATTTSDGYLIYNRETKNIELHFVYGSRPGLGTYTAPEDGAYELEVNSTGDITGFTQIS